MLTILRYARICRSVIRAEIAFISRRGLRHLIELRRKVVADGCLLTVPGRAHGFRVIDRKRLRRALELGLVVDPD